MTTSSAQATSNSAILRVKRKRNDDPIDILAIECDHKNKRIFRLAKRQNTRDIPTSFAPNATTESDLSSKSDDSVECEKTSKLSSKNEKQNGEMLQFMFVNAGKEQGRRVLDAIPQGSQTTNDISTMVEHLLSTKGEEEYVYDIYTATDPKNISPPQTQDQTLLHRVTVSNDQIWLVHEFLFNETSLVSDSDSDDGRDDALWDDQDSNAEDYWTHEYPDEDNPYLGYYTSCTGSESGSGRGFDEYDESDDEWY